MEEKLSGIEALMNCRQQLLHAELSSPPSPLALPEDMEELLSLKWNNHQSTFIHILSILRNKELYSDVTLACDGKFYSVHKLVLSTCSDYFHAILDRTNCKNPVIVLKDISCDDLDALLDYMYLGEVNVKQSRLTTLIKAAECLQIKGLAVPDQEHLQKKGKTKDIDGSSSFKRKRFCDDSNQRDSKQFKEHNGNSTVHSSPNTKNTPVLSMPVSPVHSVDNTSIHNDEARLSSAAASLNQEHISTIHTSVDSTNTNRRIKDINKCDQFQSMPIESCVKLEFDHSASKDKEFNNSCDRVFKEENGTESEANMEDINSELPDFLQQDVAAALQGSQYAQLPFSGSSYQNTMQDWQSSSSNTELPHLNFSSSDVTGLLHASKKGSKGALLPVLSQLVGCGDSDTSATFSTGFISAVAATSNASMPVNRHKCLHCIKSFSSPKDLRRHMMTHTGEKPHECPYCPYRAALKGNLKVHILGVHRVTEAMVAPLESVACGSKSDGAGLE